MPFLIDLLCPDSFHMLYSFQRVKTRYVLQQESYSDHWSRRQAAHWPLEHCYWRNLKDLHNSRSKSQKTGLNCNTGAGRIKKIWDINFNALLIPLINWQQQQWPFSAMLFGLRTFWLSCVYVPKGKPTYKTHQRITTFGNLFGSIKLVLAYQTSTTDWIKK